MTVEEISEAKHAAEVRIAQELQDLQEKTGMSLADVRVRFVDFSSMSGFARKVGAEVLIDLRVP